MKYYLYEGPVMIDKESNKDCDTNYVKIGSSCMSKDEAIKMGLLYIMILVIAFVI